MSKLLTIAIPTFNRAKLLEEQLTWLAKAIKGFESECEILISDNCSTDDTQEVVKKWQPKFHETIFKYNRQSHNIGLMNNIAACFQSATSKYVWTIGDDDPIQERTLDYVLKKLRENPDLTLMFLNCSGRDKQTDKIVVERWFNSDSDEAIADGKAVLERYLKESFGGVIFMTATIYRTELAKSALENWSYYCTNLASQAYWTGYCAAHGSVIVTKDIYLECTLFASSLEQDPKWSLRMQYRYIPEIYAKLLKIGYSKVFCLQMILQNIIKKSDWKIFLGALRRWPFLAIKIIVYYLVLVSVLTWNLLFLTPEVKSSN